jgi:hypothetical protein
MCGAFQVAGKVDHALLIARLARRLQFACKLDHLVGAEISGAAGERVRFSLKHGQVARFRERANAGNLIINLFEEERHELIDPVMRHMDFVGLETRRIKYRRAPVTAERRTG